VTPDWRGMNAPGAAACEPVATIALHKQILSGFGLKPLSAGCSATVPSRPEDDFRAGAVGSAVHS
jgi:hypothetical protein